MSGFGLGAIPSPPDPRDFALPLDMAATLPSRYSAPGMPPVLNQGSSPKCVAYSSTSVRLWQERRDGHPWLPFDPSWLYYKAQAIDGIPLPHDGTTLRAAMRVLAGTGLALVGHPDAAPAFRVKAYYAIPFSPAALKAAIFTYGPINVASRWYRNWMAPAGGVLRAPSGYVGGHASVLYGWDDADNGGSFLLRNSWGRTWGTGFGNAYAPYRYLVPELHDAWKSLDVVGDGA